LKYLKLIRIPNLIILAMGMYLLRMMVVEPLLILSHQAPQVTPLDFFLIVISTILIAAGGYIINDIEDVEIDVINKPGKVLIDNGITKDHAWNIYLGITFTGICIAFYLTFSHNIHYVAYTEIVAAGLLYFYSTTYKRMLLIGNIMVSGLTAFSLAIVYLTEPAAPAIQPLKQLATGYIIFAFIISMAREIIKDLQDIKGDNAEHCRTLPIVAGITISKIIACCFVIALLISLIIIQVMSHQWEAIISFVYVLVFIQIPLILLFVSIVIASNEADYSRCSALAKTIMVTGVLSMPVFYYSFN
jgi:4-hydroxybenzoate polyprenyltransferase